MIIVVTTLERNERTGKTNLAVSHGIDEETMRNVILSGEHPEAIGARFCKERGEWVIDEESPDESHLSKCARSTAARP